MVPQFLFLTQRMIHYRLKERFEIFGDMGYPDADDFLEKEIEDYSALHG